MTAGPGQRKPKGARGNREGKPWRRGDGRWQARAYPPEGSLTRRPRDVYGKTRAEAARKKAEQEAGWARGLGGDPDMLLGDYIRRWLDETLPQYVRSGKLAESTVDSYRDNAELHIIPDKRGMPTLRHIAIGALTAKNVRDWQDALLAKPSGRPRRTLRKGESQLPPPGTLSVRTVAYCRQILRKAIADAIRDEVGGIDRNVVDLVDPPAERQKAPRPTITTAQASALLVAMAEDKLWCYWLLAFALGFRRGEGLGMRWQDVDLEEKTWKPVLSVQVLRGEKDPRTGHRKGRLVAKELKSEASAQRVPLGESAVEALRRWHAEQAKIRLAAPRWAGFDLVFTTGVGTAIQPRNVDREWERIRRRAGVPDWVRLHDLRHACASYLLEAGANVKQVQRQLRHARMETTQIYLHALEDVPRDTADAMDRILETLRAPGRKTAT